MSARRLRRAAKRVAHDLCRRATLFGPKTAPALALVLVSTTLHAQISLFTAVDQARRNSTAVRLAQADLTRATAARAESKDVYLPSFVFGSSLGYSYGFPVGQPSVYNVEAQSLVLSFAQPDYIRAANAAMRTAKLNLQDTLDQVALDTSLDYVELDTVTRELAALDEQKHYAELLGSIEQQRVAAGIESRINATRAELVAAQADLKRLDLEARRKELREKLAHLTGLPESTIQTETAAIPGEPSFDANGMPREHVVSVQASEENARSKHLQTRGDERGSNLPLISFGIAYSRYAAFNNYQQYYLRFQHNNFDVGLQVSWPIFDATRRARARESAADAVHADVQATQAREQAEEQVTRISASLRTLAAQQRVAALERELAEEQLESVTAQLTHPSGASASGPGASGSGTGAAPLTPRDEMEAHIEERARYQQMLDAGLTLMRAELSLLRATGAINDWANTPTH